MPLTDEQEPSHPLEEGKDYYLENGYWVFTEYYLSKRGKCCGSGCRHCPYGFRKKRRLRLDSVTRLF